MKGPAGVVGVTAGEPCEPTSLIPDVTLTSARLRPSRFRGIPSSSEVRLDRGNFLEG